MAFGPVMAASGATLGCRWLGTAVSGSLVWGDRVNVTPHAMGGGGVSASCSTIWHHTTGGDHDQCHGLLCSLGDVPVLQRAFASVFFRIQPFPVRREQ